MGNEILVERNGVVLHDFLHEDSELAKAYENISKPETVAGEILFLTSYPPRECGIANYAHNLINTLNSRLDNYYGLKVCALENGETKYYYPEEVVAVLNTNVPSDYMRIAIRVNQNVDIVSVVIQHEFDLFKGQEDVLLTFIKQITKPVVVVFHSVIPDPSPELKRYIQNVTAACKSVVIMGNISKAVLLDNYHLPAGKVEVIPYGTHLVPFVNVFQLKEKLKITGQYVLTAVGLLAPGKGLETILEALPTVIKTNPGIKLLVIGKTHPEELKKGGEQYRIMLEARVKSLKLQSYVEFMNVLLTPETLKEYFQVSDISIFSSIDINRPTSSIFSLAVSCGCPIISTPTLHAREFLDEGAGLIFECRNSDDLSAKINLLLEDPALRKGISESILKRSQASAWENSALLYAKLLNNVTGNKISPDLKYPPINLDFLKMLTDKVGILRSAYRNEPDLRSGYLLDDNALALFVFCMHYKNTGDADDIPYIKKYLKFVSHCYQPSGMFFKYLDYQHKFTAQNRLENLEETQAKAIWALGYVYSMKGLLPPETTDVAALLMENICPCAEKFETAKAIALSIKGLYYYYSVGELEKDSKLIKELADKLLQKYKENYRDGWHWFEQRFTTSPSILPGALLNTWLVTGVSAYKDVAKESFEFLASKTFINNKYSVIPGDELFLFDPARKNIGERPCDVAFSVITLSKFYLMCKENEYFYRLDNACKWFLGNNRLEQMVYNPATGGCCDGLEASSLDLNQSAESALSYALARLVVEKYKFKGENHINHLV